jgi:predicted DNA repair protein MutK
MAGSSLFALIDDIATILDDVAVMTKIAAKKTAGVLGDVLALNAQQVSGVQADRELPVVWAVAKGSIRNKVILVPAALAISALIPWAVMPLLMLGGAFLCYEGFEKLAHKFLHHEAEDEQHHAELVNALASTQTDMLAFEKDKIKGAVRTDFILSAEIIVIALGTVANASFSQQVIVLVGIASIMTVGVYGIVAGIVKLDDAGLWLSQRPGQNLWQKFQHRSGSAILFAAPMLMKTLSVVGTAAMFMVGGSILGHGLHAVHTSIQQAAQSAATVPGIGGLLSAVTPTFLDALVGIIAGAAVLALVTLASRLYRMLKPAAA